MRVVKKFLLWLLILIALVLVIALFVKKDFATEQQIVINKPKAEVFEYIRHLKNQEHYGKWYTIDPNMQISYKGLDGHVGFVIHWESDNDEVGVGEQEIKKIVENERVDFELRFLKPFESTSPVFMTTESVNDKQTKVTWGFQGRMTYPFNLMLLFMDMEKIIGEDFQTGLQNLKRELEK